MEAVFERKLRNYIKQQCKQTVVYVMSMEKFKWTNIFNIFTAEETMIEGWINIDHVYYWKIETTILVCVCVMTVLTTE